MNLSDLPRCCLPPEQAASCLHSVPEEPELHAALATMSAVMVLTDAHRRITWCNAAFTRLSGYSLEEARGRSPGALLQFEGTDPAMVARMRERLRAGLSFRGVLRNRSRRGRVYWLDIDIQPLHDAAGRLVGFVAGETDITEATQHHEHMRSIVNSAVSGLVVVDADGNISACNPQAERLFEVPVGKLLGRSADATAWRLLNDGGQPLADEDSPWARAWRTGQAVSGHVVGVRLRRGGIRWIEISSDRIAGPAEGSQCVVSSFTDVSDQREAMAKLDDKRLRLRAALDGTRAGVWEWNLLTNEVHVDERWAAIGGRSPGELAPMCFSTFTDQMHPKDAARMGEALRDQACGGREFLDIECRLKHQQGHWVWVRLCGRIASLDAQGRALWLYGTVVDITQAKEAELALQKAHAQLLALFELSPVAMSLSRLGDGCFEQFNDAMVELLGHGRDKLGQLAHRDVLPPEGLALAQLHRRQLLEAGRFGPSEAEMLHANGQRIPVMLSGMRTAQADGSQRIWVLMQDLRPAKRIEQRLRTEARTDRLTGLPNRAAAMERLEHLAAHATADPQARFALLFLDFDRFKLVNDTMGHDAGDELLQHIADRLRNALRACTAPDDGDSLVARLGGDEFVVLLARARSAEAAGATARRMLDVLSRPYRVQQKDFHSSASIGIVLGDADSGNAIHLLRNADMAMYEAKRAGRGSLAFFNQGMLERLSRAVQVEEALRQALVQQQMAVAYQPIVDLETGRMGSVEALLRWTHPQLGAVSPAEFIPIAEESGLVVPLGEWVLRQACADWRRWQDEDAARAPAVMSVNLSRVQMALGGQLLVLVAAVLAEHAMPPGSLQLEVTEREVMRDPGAALALMGSLRAMGVKLAMDDFGTGASSLGCLRDYPFDVIKIDKSFIDGLSDDPATLAVLHGTITVIHNLGMVSVAEGIEHALQLGVLQSMGCRCGQGWLFSRAVPAGQVLQACQGALATG